MEECEVSSYSSELQLIFYTDECPLEIIPKLTSSEFGDSQNYYPFGLNNWTRDDIDKARRSRYDICTDPLSL